MRALVSVNPITITINLKITFITITKIIRDQQPDHVGNDASYESGSERA
jgi:hypothetical protein